MNYINYYSLISLISFSFIRNALSILCSLYLPIKLEPPYNTSLQNILLGYLLALHWIHRSISFLQYETFYSINGNFIGLRLPIHKHVTSLHEYRILNVFPQIIFIHIFYICTYTNFNCTYAIIYFICSIYISCIFWCFLKWHLKCFWIVYC